MLIRSQRRWALVGGDPTPGDPSAYDAIARDLDETATNAQDAHRRLSDLQKRVDHAIWRGKAADAFREELGKLPGNLQKLSASYDSAATAMRTYGLVLQSLQDEAGLVMDDVEAADSAEQSNQAAADAALAVDPASSVAAHQEAISAARNAIHVAQAKIDDIRGRRQAAEKKALSALNDAGDLGIQNRKWYHKALGALADAAEFVAFTLAVVAIVVVVVILMTNPVGWATLSAALAAAGPLFTAANIASGAAFIIKVVNYVLQDPETTWGEVKSDALWLGLSVGIGSVLGYLTGPALRTATVQFTERVTQIRPVLRIISETDDLLILQARTSVRIVRVAVVQPPLVPIPLDTLWDISLGLHRDIPKYLDDNPDLARDVGVRLPAGAPLAEVLGRDVSCTAIHVRPLSIAGAR